MLGKPKYNYEDRVKFTIDNETKEGTIYVIDEYGTFFYNDDVCYDIMSTIGDGTMCLYKHTSKHQIEKFEAKTSLLNNYLSHYQNGVRVA